MSRICLPYFQLKKLLDLDLDQQTVSPCKSRIKQEPNHHGAPESNIEQIDNSGKTLGLSKLRYNQEFKFTEEEPYIVALFKNKNVARDLTCLHSNHEKSHESENRDNISGALPSHYNPCLPKEKKNASGPNYSIGCRVNRPSNCCSIQNKRTFLSGSDNVVIDKETIDKVPNSNRRNHVIKKMWAVRRMRFVSKKKCKPVTFNSKPITFNKGRIGFCVCLICFRKFTRCLHVKKHIFHTHSKDICLFGKKTGKDTSGQLKLLQFCPKNCNYFTSRWEAFSKHIAACQKPVMHIIAQNSREIQDDSNSPDDVKSGERNIHSSNIGKEKCQQAWPSSDKSLDSQRQMNFFIEVYFDNEMSEKSQRETTSMS